MSILCSDPAIWGSVYHLSSTNLKIIDSGSQFGADHPDGHAAPKKRNNSRIWRMRTRDSSKSESSSIRSLSLKIRTKLTRIISGGSRLRDALYHRNRSGNEGHNICVTDGAGNLFEASEHLSDENLENILDNPQLSENLRLQAGALLRERGYALQTYALQHFILPI